MGRTNEHPAFLQRGGDSRKNWVTINELNRLIQPALSELRRLSGAVADLRMWPTVKEGGATMRQLRLKQIGPDWLRCRALDGTTELPGDIYVARDPELRQSTYAGKTIAYNSDGDAFTATFSYTSPTKRTKTIGAVAEVQVIFPYYVLDAAVANNKSTLIKAMSCSDPTGVNDPSGRPITLIEDTQRAWGRFEL